MKVYGLIGKSLQHSFSPRYFKEKFVLENLTDHRYQLFPIGDAAGIRVLVANHPEISGLNVTIPFKQAIIPYLDVIDPIAREIGAVNTITIKRNNKKIVLTGFNTDAYGFQHSCVNPGHYKPALILGTGGAALAVKYVLDRLQIPYLSVSRYPQTKCEIDYEDLNEAIISKYKFIINTTPLGQFPNIDQAPPLPYAAIGKEHFLYDLVYNPAETLFLKKGKIVGAQIQNGERMLELQADRSWTIWNA
jgi:shikimate dehydrogenase